MTEVAIAELLIKCLAAIDDGENVESKKKRLMCHIYTLCYELVQWSSTFTTYSIVLHNIPQNINFSRESSYSVVRLCIFQ